MNHIIPILYSSTLANLIFAADFSEPVSIDGWDNMCPEERALLTALLSFNTSNVNQQR